MQMITRGYGTNLSSPPIDMDKDEIVEGLDRLSQLYITVYRRAGNVDFTDGTDLGWHLLHKKSLNCLNWLLNLPPTRVVLVEVVIIMLLVKHYSQSEWTAKQ